MLSYLQFNHFFSWNSLLKIFKMSTMKLCTSITFTLSYDVASGSEITPCDKIDKPLVVYRFTGNVMTSITTSVHNDKIMTFLRQKSDFKVFVI